MAVGNLIKAAMAAFWLTAAVPVAAQTPGEATAMAPNPAAATTQLLDFMRDQDSTGFLVIMDGKILIEHYWPVPHEAPPFSNFVYGQTSDGVLLEDVASQQKSFVALLVAIAIDKGLLDIEKPVSAYLGTGWSRAAPDQEAKIRVTDLLTMSTGLDDGFHYQAPPGTIFHYNTPVYALAKRIVAAVAHQPLDAITRDWITGPLGMQDTAWLKRPAALASVGNDTGLVTTPRDTALFGAMILAGGVATNGTRVVSGASLQSLFTPSATNPAYGKLWWLNGSPYTIRALRGRVAGPLIPAAPSDLVAALGALDRRLYIVPSRKLVVVRAGAPATAKGFDEQLWLRLMKVID